MGRKLSRLNMRDETYREEEKCYMGKNMPERKWSAMNNCIQISKENFLKNVLNKNNYKGKVRENLK